MRSAISLASSVAALMLVLLAPAQAAPLGGAAGNLSEVTGDKADIVQVRHRCYWHHGYWRCPRHYPYYYGPGIYFDFGPGRHFRHHRHRW